MQAAAEARQARELTRPPERTVPAQIWLGWSAVAVGGLVMVFLAFGGRWPWSKTDESGGRWVYDRAMGGKRVCLHTLSVISDMGPGP